MEEIKLDEWIHKFHELHGTFILGDWGASCWGKTFKLNNNGIKLAARNDEGLEKIIFDTDKKNSFCNC